MIELVNNNVPKRRFTKKQVKREHNPWITKEIKKNINVRDCLYRKFAKEVNPVIRNNLYHQYKACPNKLVTDIRQRKKLHFTNFFNDNIRNCKTNWEGVNKLMNLKSKSKNNSDSKTVANEFNEYFTVNDQLSAPARLAAPAQISAPSE